MKYLRTINIKDENGLLGRTYAELKREAMPVPPFMLFSPIPDLFAGNWSLYREIFLVEKRVAREVKEAINVAVSQVNACPYCVDAHTTMLKGLNRGEIASAVVNHNMGEVRDGKTEAIIEWALNSTRPRHSLLNDPPFSATEAPEIMGAAFQFHFINRLVNIFVGENFAPLPVGKGIASWLVSRAMRRKGFIGVSRSAGQSLALLPEAPVPNDFRWAAPDPVIVQAFARMARALDDAVSKVVGDEAQRFVLKIIFDWDGEDKGISKKWVDSATDHADARTRAFARLALLTGFSAYQIHDDDISLFKAVFPADDQLLAVTAWASFQTARRIASWTRPLF